MCFLKERGREVAPATEVGAVRMCQNTMWQMLVCELQRKALRLPLSESKGCVCNTNTSGCWLHRHIFRLRRDFSLTSLWEKLSLPPTRLLYLDTAESPFSLCHLWILGENQPFFVCASSPLQIHLGPYPAWVMTFSLSVEFKKCISQLLMKLIQQKTWEMSGMRFHCPLEINGKIKYFYYKGIPE